MTDLGFHQMRRIFVLGCVSLLFLSVIARLELGGARTSAAQEKKKQPKKKQKVDGALWSFVATDRKGKQVRFQYRAADLVLYDPDTEEEIGKSVPIGDVRSRVTFNEKSEFPCEFVIRKTDPGPPPKWEGTAEFEGRSWTIQLRGLLN
jgi:hypothetical protein